MGGGLLAIFSAVVMNNRDNNSKVRRLYTRLDEVKERSDNLYTNKDVCEVHTKQMKGDIQEIKTDVKELLRRNGGKQ